jgi:sporulation protein YqfC
MTWSKNSDTKEKPGKDRKRKKAIKKSIREKFAEMLELPKDLVLDRPKLIMVGRSDMMIENYKSILEYGVSGLRINTGTGIVRITGSGLFIREISPDDIVISGMFRSVEFTDVG